jgi:alpha-beta hydrolase superfamily lysophospholipase
VAGDCAPMADHKVWLLRNDIARYRLLLKAETDKGKQQTIAEHLVEAEYNLALIDKPSRPTTPEASAHARRWRAKAEECRAVAETISSESAQLTISRLARDYDTLAESWEKVAQKRRDQDRSVG